jgi:hypothetical protein
VNIPGKRQHRIFPMLLTALTQATMKLMSNALFSYVREHCHASHIRKKSAFHPAEPKVASLPR